MKKRICSLLLALCLLCGLLVLPAEAATKADVYNCLKQAAMGGAHNTQDGCYYDGVMIDDSTGAFYAVYYWEKSKEIELSLVTNYLEVTMVLPTSMSQPYTAYIMVYDSKGTTGKVQVAASYNGGAFSSFSSFSGDTSLRSEMLSSMSTLLPLVIEYTRAVLYDGGYTLKDMGLTAYNKCTACHCMDQGKVDRKPTCGEYGKMIYTCVVCGATVSEDIAPTGNHVYDSGKAQWEPTCTTTGWIRYTCTVCGNFKEEAIPALGHDYKITEITTQGDSFHTSMAIYTCERCGKTKERRICAGVIFTDMPADDNFAHDPIDWAYFHEPQITAGTTATTFSPKNTCTRGQVVTFLWRAVGEPKPENAENPFEDVKEGAYYYDAVLWAVDQGVTTGASPTTFNPNGKCTRGQVVTFLWRAAGEPSVGSDIAPQNPFEDVRDDAYYYNAVLWAVNAGVTTGTGPTAFNPGGKCTRAQVVTFLSRAEEALTSGPTEPDDPGTPPEYFTAQSVEELLAWVNAEPSDEQQPFESFLTAARRLGSVPTAASASDELSLKLILVTGGYDRVEYFFGKDEAEKPEFEVLLELPGTEEEPKPSLDERMAQINAELAEEFELWQYAKSSATVDGAETAIWTCDGGEYAKKDSEDKELAAPTACFEWQGCFVVVRGVGDLYRTKWDDAYLAQFTLSLAALK